MIDRLIAKLRKTPTRRFERISKEAYIGGQVKLGNDCIIGNSMIHGPVDIGRGTLINGPTQIKASEGAECKIGAFCSIAANVIIRTRNHPIEQASTFSVGIGPYKNMFSTTAAGGPVVIGNDVWIGAMCVILPSVTIGNGAIVGAGSIVTRDVPAYSIAAGNPAKQLRMRFPQHVIETLNTLEWWKWPIDLIASNSQFFQAKLSSMPEGEFRELIAKLKV